MEFKIGDYVKFTNQDDHDGKGIIVSIDSYGNYLIKLDKKYTFGHNGPYYHGKPGKNYWWIGECTLLNRKPNLKIKDFERVF